MAGTVAVEQMCAKSSVVKEWRWGLGDYMKGSNVPTLPTPPPVYRVHDVMALIRRGHDQPFAK